MLDTKLLHIFCILIDCLTDDQKSLWILSHVCQDVRTFANRSLIRYHSVKSMNNRVIKQFNQHGKSSKHGSVGIGFSQNFQHSKKLFNICFNTSEIGQNLHEICCHFEKGGKWIGPFLYKLSGHIWQKVLLIDDSIVIHFDEGSFDDVHHLAFEFDTMDLMYPRWDIVDCSTDVDCVFKKIISGPKWNRYATDLESNYPLKSYSFNNLIFLCTFGMYNRYLLLRSKSDWPNDFDKPIVYQIYDSLKKNWSNSHTLDVDTLEETQLFNICWSEKDQCLTFGFENDSGIYQPFDPLNPKEKCICLRITNNEKTKEFDFNQIKPDFSLKRKVLNTLNYQLIYCDITDKMVNFCPPHPIFPNDI